MARKSGRRAGGGAAVAEGRPVSVLGVPLDLGAGRRGTDMGPSAVRIAGLHGEIRELGRGTEDLGDLEVPAVETLESRDPRAKFLPEIAKACRQAHGLVLGALDRGRFPVVLGGDHSVAAGTISGVAHHFRKRDESIGVLWVDAHGDMNTPKTSPSGNVHGMPLAAVLGHGPKALTHIGGFAPKVKPGRTVLMAVRDVDPEERKFIARSGVRVFTMSEIDAKGMRRCLEEALPILTASTAGFHVSFDMDGIDPNYAPGVGTPVQGGLTYREAHLLAEMCAKSGKLVSCEMMEVNPVMDVSNRTAQLAMELILSLLGKRIL
ncbi:MAG TPA: arginase [Planctomycetota bacterium]|nr:arginase [Planctomycetota bacterium]